MSGEGLQAFSIALRRKGFSEISVLRDIFPFAAHNSNSIDMGLPHQTQQPRERGRCR
jgi:hypothetical protein